MIKIRRFVGGAGALAVAAMLLGTAADGGSMLVTHLDDPAPGVVLGTAPSTADLLEAVAADEFPGSTVDTVGATASALLDASTPAGEPGVSSLARHVAPSCSGTGTDGNRIQVLYAVEEGGTDRYAKLLTSLRSWVADVDDTFAASAERTGGGRRVRWVHDDCVPVIKREVLPAGALKNGFKATINALKDRGYDSPNRKYLVFADATDLCGIGSFYVDSAKAGNANDGGYPQYARVDSPCWKFEAGWHSVAAHEVMHMLGGIQDDAPNSTGAGHCRDETDVMCYDDGGSSAKMLDVCAGSEDLFDCRNDDYFSTAPQADSYLDRKWNAADSSFLDVVGGAAKAPVVSISGPSTMRAGLSTTYRARSSVAGTTYRWTAQPAACLPGKRSSATVALTCPSWYTGKVKLTLAGSATNTATARSTKTVSLLRSPKATFSATVKAAKAKVERGRTVKVTVKLRYRDTAVRGSVSLHAKTANGSWRRITSARDTGVDGVYTFTVRPRAVTRYVAAIGYAAGDGWADPKGTSATVRITK